MSTVTFYTDFAKRKNSTKLPTGGTVDSDVKFLDEQNVLSPSLLVSDAHASSNYVKITNAGFDRYYFVDTTDRVSTGMTRLNLIVDVLASFKTKILANTAFVLRSASDYNVKLLDDEARHSEDVTISKVDQYLNIDASGSYIVSVANKEPYIYDSLTGSNIGTRNKPFTMYSMTTDQLVGFITQCQKSSIDKPMDYVLSVRWYPITQYKVATGDGATTEHYSEVYVAGTALRDASFLGDVGNKLPIVGTQDGMLLGSCNFTLPDTDFSYRANSWTSYTLTIPTIGDVSIDSSAVNITVNLIVDWVSGESRAYVVDTDSHAILADRKGRIGINVPVTNVSPSQYETLKAIGSVAAGVVTFAAGVATNDVASMINGGVGVMQGYTNLSQTQNNPIISGTTSGDAIYDIKYWRACVLSIVHYVPILGGQGRPLYASRTLNTLSGFTKCMRGELSIAGAYLKELEIIQNFLTTGFYIE